MSLELVLSALFSALFQPWIANRRILWRAYSAGGGDGFWDCGGGLYLGCL